MSARAGSSGRMLFDRLTFGGVLLGALAGMALMAAQMAPADPIAVNVDFSFFSPSRFHPLGTDGLGRDVLSRLVFGSRLSLIVATLATVLAAAIGTIVGLIAGAAGGPADRFLMRFVDLMLSFPTMVLLLVLAALFGSGNHFTLILLLGAATWMPLARVARKEMWSSSPGCFVEAAAGLGASPAWRLLRHLGPRVLRAVALGATSLIGEIMLMESGLSYLGLGVASPTASWGDMVRQGMPDVASAWWVVVFPGIALTLAVLGFNLTADGLGDALERS